MHSCGLKAKMGKGIVVSSYTLSLLPICLVSTPHKQSLFLLSYLSNMLTFLPSTYPSFSPVIPISLHLCIFQSTVDPREFFHVNTYKAAPLLQLQSILLYECICCLVWVSFQRRYAGSIFPNFLCPTHIQVCMELIIYIPYRLKFSVYK